MFKIQFRILGFFVPKCKYNLMKSSFIRGLSTSSSINHLNCSKEVLTDSCVKNRNEWLILLNYLKYLVKHPEECKFDRCVNILINIGDRILQYNKKCDAVVGYTTKWEWNRGLLKQIEGKIDTHQVTEDFGPSSLLNLVRLLSDLRLYHIINDYNVNDNCSSSSKFHLNSTNNGFSVNKQKSYRFFNDLIDDIDPKSFKFNNAKSKSKQIGPLRFDTDQLIVYPRILTGPFYFELTELNLHEELEKVDSESPNHPSTIVKGKFTYFINSVMTQFLEQLHILILNTNFSESKLCILSMFLSVMVYGPKLRNGSVCKIDKRVERALYKILDHICKAVRISGNEISFRSLAYLANSCKHRAGLMEFVAEKLINHSGTIGEHYLENFCFSFSRSYYSDDRLYCKLASVINEQAHTLSPVVTANLIFSFLRVGKLGLVKEKLVERLLTFSDQDLAQCGLNLLETVSRLLQGHQELQALINRINNVVMK